MRRRGPGSPAGLPADNVHLELETLNLELRLLRGVLTAEEAEICPERSRRDVENDKNRGNGTPPDHAATVFNFLLSPVAPKGSLREGGVFSSHGRKAVEWRRPGNPSFFLFEPRRGDGTLSGLAPGREDNHICAGRWVEEKGMDRMVSLRGNKYCVLSNRLAPSRGQATSRPAHYQVSVKFFA